MFRIRPTTLADADAASALLEASYTDLLRGDYTGDVLQQTLPFIVRAQPALLDSGTWYVAVAEDGTLAACGGWTKERPPTGEVVPGLGHLRHFATHPAFLRMGAARALADRCFEDAAAQGVTRFECSSTLTAEPFYASLGFRRVGVSDIPFPGGVMFPFVEMRRG